MSNIHDVSEVGPTTILRWWVPQTRDFRLLGYLTNHETFGVDQKMVDFVLFPSVICALVHCKRTEIARKLKQSIFMRTAEQVISQPSRDVNSIWQPLLRTGSN
jgi:hypothetical protein